MLRKSRGRRNFAGEIMDVLDTMCLGFIRMFFIQSRKFHSRVKIKPLSNLEQNHAVILIRTLHRSIADARGMREEKFSSGSIGERGAECGDPCELLSMGKRELRSFVKRCLRS